MKRAGSLVDYVSSDEDNNEPPKPVLKKRKLPSLSTSLIVSAPIDNPALHQGRIRSSPHVEGQYAAHIYIPVSLEGTPLRGLLQRILQRARGHVPTLHPIGVNDLEETINPREELHISLTRPIYLRAHQREDLKVAMRAISRNQTQFSASFATIAELINDEQTRTFLTLEIGAGHTELQKICTELKPLTNSLRQKGFYENPRFHASIAWALLSKASRSLPPTPALIMDTRNSLSSSTTHTTPSEHGNSSTEQQVFSNSILAQFLTIPGFPAESIATLRQEFGQELLSRAVGYFIVDEICARIGKEVHRWKLAG